MEQIIRNRFSIWNWSYLYLFKNIKFEYYTIKINKFVF